MKEVNIRIKLVYTIILVVLSIFVIIPYMEVNANIICNDGTISPKCTTCHRGCCSHHGGCSSGGSASKRNSTSSTSKSSRSNSSSYSRSSAAIASSVKKTVPVIAKKSNNNKLKKVTVDNNNVFISDNMEYKTTNEKAIVKVETDSNKANVNYNSSVMLNHGDNKEIIEVTAESGSKKEYYLTIKKINNNNRIKKILVNGSTVSLSEMKYESISKNVNIEVETEDEYAKATYNKKVELKPGVNEEIINVTAENGDIKEYKVSISYDDSLDNSAGYIAGSMAALGAGSAAVTGIYYGRKKKRGELGKHNNCSKCNKNNSPKSVYCINCGEKL